MTQERKVKPVAPPVPSQDEGRFNSASLLRQLGYDEATVKSMVPGTVNESYEDMAPDALDKLNSHINTRQNMDISAEEGVPFEPDAEQRVTDFVHAFGDKSADGLAAVRDGWNEFRRDVGEKFAKKYEQGSANVHLGMATLDWASYIDNWAKIKAQNPASILGGEENAWQKAARAKYLPKIRLLDPDLKEKEFATATGAALFMNAQIAKAALLRLTGNGEEADAIDQQMYGQVPQLVAGMAPMLPWLGENSVMDSEGGYDWDDTYATMADHGRYGDIAMGAMAFGIAAEDFFGSPLNIIGELPVRGATLARQAVAKISPSKHATILDGIAERNHTSAHAKEAVKAAEVWAEKAKTPEETVQAAQNLARAKQRMEQYEDPGKYEVIQLRPHRRSPDFPIQPYEYQWDPITQQRVITGGEDIAEAQRFARQHALREGPPLITDWSAPEAYVATRALLGPDDAEYAGDALNMLVRGATIDDVSVAPLAPEYYTLPDVSTSLVDHRALALNARLAKAEAKAAIPHQLTDLDELEKEIKDGLAAAKKLQGGKIQAGTAAGQASHSMGAGYGKSIDVLRAELKRIKKLKADYAARGIEDFDASALPKQQPGIMQSPERHNRWLEVAADRVIRSAYPGGLNISAVNTMLGQGAGPMREAQRYYMSFDKEAYERIRSSTLRFDDSSKASQHLITSEGEKAGIIKKRSNFNMVKHFSPYKVNKEKARQAYDLLNTPKADPGFEQLYKASSTEMQRFHDRIRTVLDHYADLHGISDTDRFLEGYIHHMLDPSLFANGARPFEMVGLPGRGEVFARHLLHRTSNRDDYERDAILALDVYMRAANRKLILEPMYKDIEMVGVELAKKHKNSAHITYANDLVSGMKGLPSYLGAKVDEVIAGASSGGRGVKLPTFTKNGIEMKEKVWQPGTLDRTAYGFTSAVYRALISGNPTYALVQIASGLATGAGRYGLLGTSRGIMRLATKEGQELSKVAGTYRPFVDFIESPFSKQLTELADKIPSPATGLTNSKVELISRQLTYLCELDLRLKQGGHKDIKSAKAAGELKRYMFESLRKSEEINHLFGPLGRSPWAMRTFGTAGSATAQQLLSYIPKQTEELVAQFVEHPGYIFRWLMVSGWMTRQAANMGVDLTETVGPGYMPDAPTDLMSPAVDMLLTNLDLMQAMADHDPEGVAKSTAKLTQLLQYAVPGSQMVLAISKSKQRMRDETVNTAAGNPLYRMDMGLGHREIDGKPSGIGQETLPTFFMQPNLSETLTRRGMQAMRQEEQRFGHNAAKAIDEFIEAVEANDYEKAAQIEENLGNPYRIRLSGSTMLQKAQSARVVAQTVRSYQGNKKLMDVNNKIMKEHGINFTP